MPSSIASAESCISPSISRRSRLSWSSFAASSRARAWRPWRAGTRCRATCPSGARRRSGAARPRSPGRRPRLAAAARPASSSRAAMPGQALPARMRARPCATRMRLLASSFTTSATVPSATMSSSSASVGSGARSERAAPAQLRAQRQHHVEDHAHAREVLARESRSPPGWDSRCTRHAAARAGQVMVGDQHAHAEAIGLVHAGDRGDAVVHRDEDVGLAMRRPRARSPA